MEQNEMALTALQMQKLEEKQKSVTYSGPATDTLHWNGQKENHFTGNLIKALKAAEPYLSQIGASYPHGAKAFYNAHPRGELFHVFEALFLAQLIWEVMEDWPADGAE